MAASTSCSATRWCVRAKAAVAVKRLVRHLLGRIIAQIHIRHKNDLVGVERPGDASADEEVQQISDTALTAADELT
jgi:hypothetical protein